MNFRVYWKYAAMCVTFYNIIVLPVRIGQFRQVSSDNFSWWWGLFDYAFDVLLLVDIYLNARVFIFLDLEGEITIGKIDFANSYAKIGSFYSDVFSILPFDLLAISVGSSYLPFLRLNRIARVRGLGVYLEHTFDDLKFFHVHLSNLSRRLLVLCILFLCSCHWVCLLWIFIGNLSLDCRESPCESIRPNYFNVDHCEDCSFARKYCRSFYGATSSLITVGFGDIVPVNTVETILMTAFELWGAFLCTCIVATFSSIFSAGDISTAMQMRRIENMKTFLHKKKLPHELTTQLATYFNSASKLHLALDEKMTLSAFPIHLQMEAVMFMAKDAIAKVPFFVVCGPNFINSIAAHLVGVVFSPASFVFVKGQLDDCMYVLRSGSVCISDDESSIEMEEPGAYFGEIALFSNEPRLQNLKAISYCEMFQLSRVSFVLVLSMFSGKRTKAEMFVLAINAAKQKKQVQRTPCGPFENLPLPHVLSNFRCAWTIVVFCFLLYTCITLPFRLAFLSDDFHAIGKLFSICSCPFPFPF